MLILSDNKAVRGVLDLKNIEPLHALMEKHDFSYELVNFQALEFFIQTGKTTIRYRGKSLSQHESTYITRVGKYPMVSTLVARFLEKRGVPCVDTYHRYGATSGKLAQMFVLAEAGLSVPKTYYSPAYTEEKLLRAKDFLHLPLVAKKIYSARGEGVFLIRTKTELLALLKRRDRNNYIMQEFIPNQSDFRLFITGKKVGAFEERIRQNKKDFRNNASLGGKEIYSDPRKAALPLRKMAIQAAETLCIEVAGVDIVISSATKKKYIFEVNKCPGFTFDDPKSTELASLFHYLRQFERGAIKVRKRA